MLTASSADGVACLLSPDVQLALHAANTSCRQGDLTTPSGQGFVSVLPYLKQDLDTQTVTNAGVLLEKQLVLFCPNIGLLSTCVLSLIPLLRPFTWQSLLLPVLPDNLLSFLEAPVPFVIGVQVSSCFCMCCNSLSRRLS